MPLEQAMAKVGPMRRHHPIATLTSKCGRPHSALVWAARVVIDIKHFVAAPLPEGAVCHGSKATLPLSRSHSKVVSSSKTSNTWVCVYSLPRRRGWKAWARLVWKGRRRAHAKPWFKLKAPQSNQTKQTNQHEYIQASGVIIVP